MGVHTFVAQPHAGVAESLIGRHEHAAVLASVMSGVTGIVALISLILFRSAERLPSWSVASVLVLSLATSGLMGWTANLGGQIHHTEIRSGFKAPAETENEHKQKSEGEEKEE